MSYLSIHILETEIYPKKNDTSIIIIYDDNEENFYLYGSRRPCDIPYSYVYHRTELDSLIHFIGLVMDNSASSFTFEYNHLYIPDEDLDYVDHNYLKSQINEHNEIIAYEDLKINKKEIKRNLKKLFNI
jgi:hypothetical protein